MNTIINRWEVCMDNNQQETYETFPTFEAAWDHYRTHRFTAGTGVALYDLVDQELVCNNLDILETVKPLHDFPLLAAYVGGGVDESSAISPETFRNMGWMLQYCSAEQAAAAEAQLAESGLTEAGVWSYSYELVDSDPRFPLAWDISNEYHK